MFGLGSQTRPVSDVCPHAGGQWTPNINKLIPQLRNGGSFKYLYRPCSPRVPLLLRTANCTLLCKLQPRLPAKLSRLRSSSCTAGSLIMYRSALVKGKSLERTPHIVNHLWFPGPFRAMENDVFPVPVPLCARIFPGKWTLYFIARHAINVRGTLRDETRRMKLLLLTWTPYGGG